MFEFDDIVISGWPRKANEFMFHLIRTKPDGFSADDFNSLCVGAKMPPDVIKRLSGKVFREYQAANYIKKTKAYKLSERNSQPLPVWVSASEQSKLASQNV